MDVYLFWQAIAIVFIGTILLRFAGRKTISEMTLAETVLMISIGTLIIQPVTTKSVWSSFLVGLVLVATLLLLQYGQVKSNILERIITGTAVVVIEDGQIVEKELVKLHMTVDQLEMHLRRNQISSINDVQLATIEPSGHLAYILKESAQPATKADIEQLYTLIQSVQHQQTNKSHDTYQKKNKDNLFSEVHTQTHKNLPPKHLQ